VFIPLAEASGLIERIDSFVMRAACVEATRWPEAHSISVNVSARWFQNKRPKLSKLVEQALSRSGLLPHRLVIELTERVLIVDPKVALEEMRTLQAMGVHVALDDFGTGYSSLGYIEAFPFGVVKLDKAFVRGLGNSRRAEAVGRAVIRLGHDLGMTIVAEGVENQHQLAFLRQEGCDFVQGYLIGRPGSSVLTSP
jgi:EAL domain-containing protein (putative c-di-GMP-specific phosphodiesterase class I)